MATDPHRGLSPHDSHVRKHPHRPKCWNPQSSRVEDQLGDQLGVILEAREFEEEFIITHHSPRLHMLTPAAFGTVDRVPMDHFNVVGFYD